MNQLQKVFNYQSNEVRTIIKNGEPWFVARDVCEAIEIDVTQARRLDSDEKGLHSIQTPGGYQEMLVVNEPGLYSLVLGSRKDEAKAFKRWITHEVIPSIRKHGAYMTDDSIEKALTDPDFLIKLATNLKEEKQKRIAAEQQIEVNKPKVIFADAVEVSNDSILIGQLAKILRQNGIDVGQNRLFHLLRVNGYLGKSGDNYNIPTQKAMDLKLFEIKKRTINNPDGSVRVTTTTKVSGKGQIYFINKFCKEAS